MNIQRLRNLTTGKIHTSEQDMIADIQRLVGEPGLSDFQIPFAVRALLPWLRQKVSDPRFWNDRRDLMHVGEIEVPPMTAQERRAYFRTFQRKPHLMHSVPRPGELLDTNNTASGQSMPRFKAIPRGALGGANVALTGASDSKAWSLSIGTAQEKSQAERLADGLNRLLADGILRAEISNPKTGESLKTGKPSISRAIEPIEIIISGGNVQDVENIPSGVTVEVRDYDNGEEVDATLTDEQLAEEGCARDADGKIYQRATYEGEEEAGEHEVKAPTV